MLYGPLAAAFAFVLWGIFPIYIKQLQHVPAAELVAHRSAWSLLFVAVLLASLRRLAWLPDVLRRPRALGIYALSAFLLSANWLLYVWAVNNDRVLDASLGYFITPLVNVLLGYVVLRERPRQLQWISVALAGVGVLWLALGTGQLPWIGLMLAFSFGTYGLLRKMAALGAIEGLALETLFQAPLAVGYLLFLAAQGTGQFGQESRTDWLLLLSGPITAVPLLLFAAGARRVTMATLGLLQYIGPTIQFVLGIWLYHEPFSASRGIGFALIWTALIIYTAESWWTLRSSRRGAVPAA